MDFFVSYTRSDRPWAEWISWQLEAAGYRVILQAWDFQPGTNFVLKMDDALKRANQTLLVLSQAFLASKFTEAEWAATVARDPTGSERKVLPVRVSPVEAEGLLASIVYVDLVDCDEPEATARC